MKLSAFLCAKSIIRTASKQEKAPVGSILEESWFGYSINSESSADFAEAGVELKATPYLHTTKGIRAKERLVCNIINYMEEYKSTFYTSSFWKKCNTILLMSYEHKDGVEKGDFTIDEATLFSFPTVDLAIIEHDWEQIITKVRNGMAHEISEGDTLYLGACTKGATANTLRPQPFSDIMAKQRAYSLKQSYMTYVLNNYIFGNEADEHIIKEPALLQDNSFEGYLLQKVRPYLGRTQKSILNEFHLETTAKNVNELILARILGLKGKITSTEEFKKANIVPKTIRVNTDGSITESMSFPTFDFIELSHETWEESTLRNYLAPAKFLFVIFQENHTGELVLDRLKFWNIPEEDLEEVHRVWQRTVDIINGGIKLESDGLVIHNNLPKQSESRVAHVRPHGKNSTDTLALPDGRQMTKQCFWLNRTYIMQQIL